MVACLVYFAQQAQYAIAALTRGSASVSKKPARGAHSQSLGQPSGGFLGTAANYRRQQHTCAIRCRGLQPHCQYVTPTQGRVAVTRRCVAGQLVGTCVLRPCRSGYEALHQEHQSPRMPDWFGGGKRTARRSFSRQFHDRVRCCSVLRSERVSGVRVRVNVSERVQLP